MRNKNPEERASQKAKLGSDAAILAALLSEQPLEKKRLIEKAKIDDSTFSRVEPLLLNMKLIKRVEGRYALFNYESLVVDMEDVFKELREENRSVVKIDELANKIGKPPERIRKEAYRLAKKYDMIISYE